MSNLSFKSILVLFSLTFFFSSSYAVGGDGSKSKKLCVRNAISNDGDNVNSYFAIEGITDAENQDNEVKIYNRWGVEVFSIKGYDGDLQKNISGRPERAFFGISDGRATFGSDQKLPTGTYFYTLIISTTGGGQKSQAGYLYIN